ncbi:protein-disulfide reductase DsbD [Thiomicrorhabdus sp.]|uniref:protein-disulfide reductase DsbD n=1 Tax=Thiomicrorhabdus sp. TaxID=2039724 RepID=UPI0029C8C708|nr:protein-disulfide reductase DsbD [Thiomicrorhabdus sp.]
MRRAKNLTLYLIQIFIIAFGLQAHSALADELLDVDQAFQLSQPTVQDGKIHVEWRIADDYKLYKDKMSVSATQIKLQQPVYSKAKTVEDELFGRTEVFTHQASIDIPYNGQAASTDITVKYQGCADKIGVCYPPQTRTFSIELPPAFTPSSLGALDSFLKQETEEPELLDAEDAFRFAVDQSDAANIKLTWQIAHGYHLYQDKIKTKLLKGDADLAPLSLPDAEQIDDPLFGKTAVYHGDLQAELHIKQATSGSEIQIEYQGCSAEAGVCYPPVRKTIRLDAVSAGSTSEPAANTVSTGAEPALSETDQIADTLKNSSVWIVIATFFLFGLLLAFTPCVFPMIPILSSIIVGQGDQLTTRRAFIMSLVYVLAMSVTYTVAGVLAGLFGENLQAAFQNPWIIGSFSVIFILLAMSMFGFYELQLPSSLQSKLTNLSNKQQGGTLTGVAIMGFLSALIVGPCVAPPLAGALIYIGQTGDALLGGTALFAMSMGMGLPLLLLGTSAGKLLPRAGAWMDAVKAVFGVALIGVAIWMAERILPSEIVLLSWALLFIISAVYLGSFESTAEKSGWFKLFKGIGLTLFLYGALILAGLLGGSQNMLQPLKVFQGGSGPQAAHEEHLAFQQIKSLNDLQQVLASGKPVMLDFYADWCISCKEMEKFTFSDSKVQAALSGVTLIQADVTANDTIDKALMKHFNLIGPPAILFFDAQGQERKAQRVVGFKDAATFEQIVKQAY